jgi:uncharacterized protein (DUF305 family)
MRPTLTRRRLLIGAAVGSAGFAAGAAVGTARAASAEEALPSDADIGFCTDMSFHHGQALAMCQRVLGRDTGDPVQAAAAEVLQNQAIELGQMRAWLTDWGASTEPPTIVMAWMGADGAPHHGHDATDHTQGVPASMMPGMATAEQLDDLSTLDGLARGRRWLELMRAHHVGAIQMATIAADLVTFDKVRRLAAAQVAVQTYEISQYDLLLAGPYAA